MRRTPALTVSALALTLALGLAGCASSPAESDPADEQSSSAEPSDAASTSSEPTAPSQPADSSDAAATGATVVGDGYSYTLPEGWAEQDAAVAPGTDTVATDLGATGNFATNINVVLSAAGAFTPEEVETAAANELESSGASGVTVLDRLTVADGEAAHITAEMTSAGLTYQIHQYYVTNADQTYIFTFSFTDAVADAEAADIAESVLATWTWN
jgi:hypothetical protein